ncbi:MAG: hypothetical protein NTV08_14445 [Verrucomicrobia bacterium]|jgi:hypothetical protein|nr:hypothetical protein [Verrucomicrobiota bacterium]
MYKRAGQLARLGRPIDLVGPSKSVKRRRKKNKGAKAPTIRKKKPVKSVGSKSEKALGSCVPDSLPQPKSTADETSAESIAPQIEDDPNRKQYYEQCLVEYQQRKAAELARKPKPQRRSIIEDIRDKARGQSKASHL